jgi:hypothetical protein
LGIDIGSSVEKFDLDDEGHFSASSVLAPQGLASLLGAPRVEMSAQGSASRGISMRMESKVGKSSSKWSRLADGSYSRLADNGDKSSAPASGPIALDTLTLPRLALLGLATPGSKFQARFFSMGSEPSIGTVERPLGSNIFTATADKLRIAVEVDAEGRPFKIEIKDGDQSANSKLIDGGCQFRTKP